MNQVREEPSPVVLDLIRQAGLAFAGTVPEDQTIYEYDMNGRPTVEIPETSPALTAAYEIFDRIIR
jgi:CO dehydrogenase maturation factor